LTRLFLTLKCPDTIGIIHNVTGCLAENNCNIVESNQWTDSSNNTFYMRVAFDSYTFDYVDLSDLFQSVATKFDMTYRVYEDRKTRVLILVSKSDHCLLDLLYRASNNSLPIDVVAIVSNHESIEPIANQYKVPFFYWPAYHYNRKDQEAAIFNLYQAEYIDLVVLARYMQVLSPDLCDKLGAKKVINVHHSFLPSFSGSQPYQQAWKKGVKLIGATAHYVTSVLDDGPIIEQEVERVDHSYTPEKLIAIGRDIETTVLARAVRYHAEHRIFINDNKTVVFK